MNLTDLNFQVRELIDDPAKFKFSDSVFTFEVTRASTVIADALNFPSERSSSLGLVEDQANYLLPADISNLVAVRIIPENGSEPSTTLTERMRYELQVVDDLTNDNVTDPKYYALVSGKGAQEDQLELIFNIAPRRSAANAIIIDYQIKYDFDSGVSFDTQYTPFPSKFDGAMVDLVSANLLQRSDDASDIQRGQFLETRARDYIADYAMMNSLSFWEEDCSRPFP